MPPKTPARTTAFNLDAVRQRMLQDLQIPEDLLQKAVIKARQKLDAKTTKFFTFQGRVMEQVDVEDHEVQQRAIDQIFRFADVFGRGNESSSNRAPSIAMELDAKTGVMRLVFGETPVAALAPVSESVAQPALPEVVAAPFDDVVGEPATEEEPQVIKLRDGKLSEEMVRQLRDED